MKLIIFLISLSITLSGQVFSQDCAPSSLEVLGNDLNKSIDQFENYHGCLSKYGREACQYQAKSIDSCIKRYKDTSIEENKENCKIGFLLKYKAKISLPFIDVNELEEKLEDKHFLSKILDSKVKGNNGEFTSETKIPLYGVLKNKMHIKKVSDGHYQIVSDDYNMALIMSKIDIIIEGNELIITSRTYPKNSIAGIWGVKGSLKSRIEDTIETLADEIGGTVND